MNQDGDVIILLQATSHAIRAEKLLSDASIECRIVPVPKYLSSDCGVCIRIRKKDQAAALTAIKQGNLQILQCYDIK